MTPLCLRERRERVLQQPIRNDTHCSTTQQAVTDKRKGKGEDRGQRDDNGREQRAEREESREHREQRGERRGQRSGIREQGA
jgi:hypothetical protein